MGTQWHNKNASPMSPEECKSQLDQYLHDKISATELLAKEQQHNVDLKEAVVALARRNVKQGKV